MSLNSSPALNVHFPTQSGAGVGQDAEWCELEADGVRRRIRFHDYADIYSIQGLYEHLFYERLKCQSPTVVADLLVEQVTAAGEDPADLVVLDLGAGNGMVAEALKDRGVPTHVGVDIVPEAGMATERDRPGLYEAYHVCDMLDTPAEVRAHLEQMEFTAMTSVAALGFGDVPPEVFASGVDLVQDGGWLAFTIKEDFLHETGDDSGFSELIRTMLADGRLEERARRRYQHRLGVSGKPLHYVAMVGIKRG